MPLWTADPLSQATDKAKALLGKTRHVPKNIPAMDWRDVPDFYASLEEPTLTHLALRLLILTGVRSGPLRNLRLDQIVGDVWTVPAEAMKGRKGATNDFRVPLSAEAQRVIGVRSGDYVRPDAATLAQREAEQRAEAQKRAAQAAQVWNEAQPIEGTIAETYLRGRGITCDFGQVLRFHGECWHGPTAKRYPAMVAAVQGASLPAVHRTLPSRPKRHKPMVATWRTSPARHRRRRNMRLASRAL